jgi:hypothetical protein
MPIDKKQKIATYILIAVALGFSVYFFVSLFLDPLNRGPIPISNFNQTSNAIPTLTDDVDACVVNPTSDCDQEMLKIKLFCNENKDAHIPVCSETRIQRYIDQRGLERPTIKTG